MKPPEPRDDAHRQIVPKIEDQAMLEWLESLFDLNPPNAEDQPKGGEHKPRSTPDNFPERIELRPIFGKGGKDQGKPIHHRDWKPMQAAPPKKEALLVLANEFHGRAQVDCNGLGHQQRYGLFAYSNLKGGAGIPAAGSANHYSRYLFVVTPTGKIYGDREGPAADDEDSHRDRLLTSALQHNRWMTEHHTETMSGMMKLQQEMLKDLFKERAQMEADRREMIRQNEELASKKQERELAAEMQRVKLTVVADVWGSIKGLLPAVAAHMTKGKVGIVQGLKQFVDGLSDDTRWALFGKWEEGVLLKPGLLQVEQTTMLGKIIDGDLPPTTLAQFIASLSSEQMAGAQQLLRPDQIQSLIALGRAATEAEESNAKAAAASP